MALLQILQYLTILSLVLYQIPSNVLADANSTRGFTQVSLNNSNLIVQKPYNVPVHSRYSFTKGVHKLWVYSKDKAHAPNSNTRPRTELRVHGYDYTSGVWQFEGYGYVPKGTTGVCIMQIFGGSSSATTLMLWVYKGSLTYYDSSVLEQNIYNRWFKLNVIHDVDVDASNIKVYVDEMLKYQGVHRGGHTHYFKFGVYEQIDSSNYMESHWKDIKVFKK